MAPSSAGLGIKPLLCLQLEPLCTTWGSLSPPLGNTRLHVVKLLASALSANDAALTQELLALDVPNTMLVRWAGLDGVGWGGAAPVGQVSQCQPVSPSRTFFSTMCSTTFFTPKWRYV